MHKQLLLVGILISATAYSQNASNGNLNTPQTAANTITIQHQSSIDYTPDEIEMHVVLLEYVKTDPETQQTTTIEMAELEKQLLEKIKPYGLDKSDLTLAEISDQVQNTNNNGYGYVQPMGYTNTQKRLIRKGFSITWSRSIDQLQPFMEALRFSGIQSIRLQTGISDRKTLDLKEQLLKKVMDESKEQAELVARINDISLGEIVSCDINPLNNGYSVGEAMYPNYGNYNNYYGSINGSLDKDQMKMSISVVYELK